MNNLDLIKWIHSDMEFVVRDNDPYTCYGGVLSEWEPEDPMKMKYGLEEPVFSDRLHTKNQFYELCEQCIHEGREDTYFTINSFAVPKKSSRYVRHLNAIALDYDYYKLESFQNLTPRQMYEDHIKDTLPCTPSAVIDSGRGLYVLYIFNHASVAMVSLYKAVYKHLYEQQKQFGMDAKAMNITQVIRIPGTVNTRSMSDVEILETNDTAYTIQELAQIILPFSLEKTKEFKKRQKKAQKKAQTDEIPECLSNIIEDFKTLIRLRKGDCRGYREYMIFVLQEKMNYYGVVREKALEISHEINAIFKEPLQDAEIIKRCKPARKYPHTTSKSKIMRALDITDEEAKKLIYFRNAQQDRNTKRRRQRRHGLLNRSEKQIKLLERRQKVVEGIIQGKTLASIQKEYKESKRTFKRDLAYIVAHPNEFKELYMVLLKRFLESLQCVLEEKVHTQKNIDVKKQFSMVNTS